MTLRGCGLVATVLAALVAPAGAVELAPTVGVNLPDREAADYDPGLHLGLSLGARLTPLFSLHGQFHFNWLDAEDAPPDWSAHQFSIAAAPLFHPISTPDLRLVIGPTLGWFFWDEEGEVLGVELGGDARGWVLGGQLAVLIPLRWGATLGPIVTYTRLIPEEICGRAFGTGSCDDSPDDQDAGVLTIALGLWFE